MITNITPLVSHKSDINKNINHNTNMHICARYFAEWLPYSCNLNLTHAKRTLRSPLMLTRMALIKKTNSRCWWVQWRKGALHIAGENVNSIHNGNQRQVPCKKLSPSWTCTQRNQGQQATGVTAQSSVYMGQYPCQRTSQGVYQEMNGYGAWGVGTNRLLLTHKEEWHKVISRHMTRARDYGKQKKWDSHKYFFPNK